MKQYIEQFVKQAIPILLSALLAALITFLQSITAQIDGGQGVQEVTKESGLLGAVLKTAHSTLALLKRTPFV